MMQPTDRVGITAQLSAFLDGHISENAFLEWLKPVVLGEVELFDTDAPLIAKVVNVFEDASITPERKLTLLQRMTACFQSNLSNEEVAQILPLISGQDRLCEFAYRRQAGIVTRTSFVAFVSDSSLPREVKRWLLESSPDAVQYLCNALRSYDYQEVLTLVRVSQSRR